MNITTITTTCRKPLSAVNRVLTVALLSTTIGVSAQLVGGAGIVSARCSGDATIHSNSPDNRARETHKDNDNGTCESEDWAYTGRLCDMINGDAHRGKVQWKDTNTDGFKVTPAAYQGDNCSSSAVPGTLWNFTDGNNTSKVKVCSTNLAGDEVNCTSWLTNSGY